MIDLSIFALIIWERLFLDKHYSICEGMQTEVIKKKCHNAY